MVAGGDGWWLWVATKGCGAWVCFRVVVVMVVMGGEWWW